MTSYYGQCSTCGYWVCTCDRQWREGTRTPDEEHADRLLAVCDQLRKERDALQALHFHGAYQLCGNVEHRFILGPKRMACPACAHERLKRDHLIDRLGWVEMGGSLEEWREVDARLRAMQRAALDE